MLRCLSYPTEKPITDNICYLFIVFIRLLRAIVSVLAMPDENRPHGDEKSPKPALNARDLESQGIYYFEDVFPGNNVEAQRQLGRKWVI